MDISFKDKFTVLWRKYFNNAELPLAYYYTAGEGGTELVKPGSLSRCVIGSVMEVRKGRSLRFNAASIGCFGGRRYLGFAEKLRPDFEYFLSCGIPGKIEGERYKKSPEIVKEILNTWGVFKAPQPFIVFKRWDNLEPSDNPEIVVFFARIDVLSGLFTLANFDEARPDGVITPMSSGCASIVSYPYREKDTARPRAVLGMFDPSARPLVTGDVLSFAVPMQKFVTMVENMEESFLTTPTWQENQKRIP